MKIGMPSVHAPVSTPYFTPTPARRRWTGHFFARCPTIDGNHHAMYRTTPSTMPGARSRRLFMA